MSTQPRVSAGAILAGRWQIQEFIGSGDTGEVYAARDMHGAGSFALKLFWPSALEKPEIWTLLQQASRTASGLGVDGVARAYDFGIDANSARPFSVSERVSWGSLAERVAERGVLRPSEMATAFAVLARALDAAHAVGLVHRDLKPENVFISPDNPNWVRISDFGVTMLRIASPPPPGWAGRVGWVAPEAADPSARATPAMDIYTLGLVTFYALSGGMLHRTGRAEPIDASALWQEIATPLDSAALRARELGASLDRGFDAWFARALAPLPQDRFPSVGEMASAFQAVVRTLGTSPVDAAARLPGVAAAIAQPLIFQPEGPAPGAPIPKTEVSAQHPDPAVESLNLSAPPPGPRRRAAPLWIGAAAICVALGGLAAFALYPRARVVATETAAARESSPPTTSAAAVAAPVAAAPNAASVTAAPSAPATSTATTATAPLAVVTPGAKLGPSSADPAATSTQATKSVMTAAKPTPATKPVAAAKPVVAAKPAPSNKSAATVVATAAKTPSKPSNPLSAPAKKKCGSVFIPCK